MVDRKRVGLIYSYDEGWVAGAYYIQNLVNALNYLPDYKKPILKIITFNKEDYENFITNIKYPYLESISFPVSYSLPQRILNKGFRLLFKKNFFEKLPNSKNIDVLFPAYEHEYLELVENAKRLYWIPDFQEHYLPHFFSEDELVKRKEWHKQLINQRANIIFSSKDARKDYFNLYEPTQNKTFILNFAVTHPIGYKEIDSLQLLKKYNLPTPYFFSPNQFWQHKNQKVILKALKILKGENIKCLVAFSGNENDYRNPGYFTNLKNYITDNNLEDYVKFLGFIDRKEQLKLMSEAISIIQPSLFEGWSTVVEDAKAMGQSMILSNLDVHYEQVSNEEAFFFDPLDHEMLAEIMKKLMIKGNVAAFKNDYNKNIIKFGEDFINIIEQI